MDHMMVSIGRYIETNYEAFGLASPNDLRLTEKSSAPLVDGGRWLVILAMRTLPDHSRGVPFNNLLKPGVKGERFHTLVEIECKTRAPDPSKVFYWNAARQFRDKVYKALAGVSRTGLKIPRYDWTDKDNPVEAGEIWFEIDPMRNSPVEDPIEDPNDPANKSIFLTYNVRWWLPI